MTIPMRITIDYTGGMKQAISVLQAYEKLYPEQYHGKRGTVQATYGACPVAIPVEISCDQELPHHLQTLHLLTHGDVELTHETTQSFHTLKALGFPVEFTELDRMVLTGKHKKARKLVAKTMAQLFGLKVQEWIDTLAETKGIAEGVPAYIPLPN